MNIIEAVNSGKRFKRSNWELYILPPENIIEGLKWETNSPYNPSTACLNANDFHLREQSITISESELEKAYYDVYVKGPNAITNFRAIKQKLGFK